MASAAVFWHYQRKLSLGGTPIAENRENIEVKTQQKRRTESEGSVTSYHNEADEARRVSSPGDSDDETLENTPKPKGRRRFSLDFLFSRKSKGKSAKSQKSKRSQSTVENSEAYTADNETQFRSYKYPGFSGAEFALAM